MTSEAMCASSVWSVRRNFRRAGTLKNRSRTVITVPCGKRRFIAAEDLAAGDLDGRAGGLVRRARFEQQPRNGGDGRQRFAAEAERRDGEQIVRVAQLAGGVALEGEQRVVAQHAAAVVGDADQAPPAAFDFDAEIAWRRRRASFREAL